MWPVGGNTSNSRASVRVADRISISEFLLSRAICKPILPFGVQLGFHINVGTKFVTDGIRIQ